MVAASHRIAAGQRGRSVGVAGDYGVVAHAGSASLVDVSRSSHEEPAGTVVVPTGSLLKGCLAYSPLCVGQCNHLGLSGCVMRR